MIRIVAGCDMASRTILLLNLPPKTFIGIDLATFNSSPNFHGITNIPPGLHFLYAGTDASLSVRQGFWLTLTKPVVFKWNSDTEHLDPLPATSESAQAAIRALPSLSQRLVDYNALIDATKDLQDPKEAQDEPDAPNTDTPSERSTWHVLSSHITPRLLARILGNEWTLTSISSSPLDDEHIPGFSTDESSTILSHTQTLNLLPIDLKQTWPDTALGRDRTIMARDRSWYLSHLIEQLQTPTAGSDMAAVSREKAAAELLGEIQFCFLMVLCLANYSCFEQWKRLLSVVFSCRKALTEVEGWFCEAVDVVRCQLGRVEDVEGGLFEMGDEVGSGWLRKLLRMFRGVADEEMGETKGKAKEEGLRAKLGELEEWLKEKYGWENNVLRKGMVQLEDGEMVELEADGFDEEEESGEYAPVVVET